MAILDQTPDTIADIICRRAGCKSNLLDWYDDSGYVDIQHGDNPEHRRTFVVPDEVNPMHLWELTDIHGGTFEEWLNAIHSLEPEVK